MASEPRRYFTVEEYLAFEEASPIRHEYVGGFLYAMVGSTIRHSLIVTNLTTALRVASRRTRCTVHSQAMRVRADNDLFYYPDIVLYCGNADPETRDLYDADTIVEVLSPSTASVDRREKLRAYLRINGLSTYLIVWQDQRRVERHYRDGDTWRQIDLVHDGTIHLSTLGIDLSLDEIYEGVPLPLA